MTKRHRNDASSDIEVHISSNTSRWTKENCIALKILYVNASDISEIIMTSQLDDHYKQLEGWDKQRNDYPSRKIATIMKKVANVLQEDHRKVDSFLMSLLEYLGFDDDPLLMHPQYDYSTFMGNDQKITSKVEYMVTRGDAYVVLIARGVSELTDWSEPQIAGAIFASAYHNVTINGLAYPFNIYAIRVVSTKFTFYKAMVTRKYLEECVHGLPIRNILEIKRYPPQPPATENQKYTLNAWDFADEQDRIRILETFKGLRDSQSF